MVKTMTKQSKTIIYYSLFIAGCLILGGLFYLLKSENYEAGQTVSFLIGLFVIAILTTGFVIYKRVKLDKDVNRLNEEYFKSYEKIGDIMAASSLSIYERRETQKDVLGIFLLAQQDNRPIEDVMKNGEQEFVDEIQKSFGYRNKVVFSLLSGLQYSIIYVFMVQAFYWFERINEWTFFEAESDLSLSVFLLPFAFIVIPFIKRFIKEGKLMYMILLPIASFALSVGLIELLDALFGDTAAIQTLIDGQASFIPSFFALVIWLAVFGAAQLGKWLLRMRSLRML